MLTLSVFKVNLWISSGLMRSLMSTDRVLTKNISDAWLMEGGSNFLMGTEVSNLASSFSVLALHGVLPVSIS